ncbi:hypothetical protein GTCCBUS3UF5_14740 [Geobacillus thermoleovorans CCB_US3_UF5]|jgi:hypothetical protein|uniref:Uncharacterized protein n=3 Tax=Geobacillus thermoleovorans group TaxID=1505648 RepID=A0A2Z3N276_GEOTH|nr:hypothetical protein GTCCBUS3UF5_14740 [Geobacillus thermoleovorans CCB_US3_UF5]AUI35768.1 hypothetical protein CWI35_03840 [[Bacillus] caldolyticus]AWO73247.1 hypothetical protein C1N76_00800 [Geobacillus thermoleovorans]QCK82582.1 hypothetical protein E5Z46_10205 [Geobacillus kaustophilus NBRC 102445]TRY45229.1 hypothetical protein FOI67_00170 [Geobacillus sp. LEMMJ02]
MNCSAVHDIIVNKRKKAAIVGCFFPACQFIHAGVNDHGETKAKKKREAVKNTAMDGNNPL